MKNESKNNGYREAIFLFVKVSGWIALPIVLTLFLGRYLDDKYDTAPWILIGSAVISFVLSIFGIKKILARYLQEIAKENLENKNGK